jgi:RHS repeat-associated protein
MIFNSSTGQPCYDADFGPFGEERTYVLNCPNQNNYKFEGKERDTETQNDDFGARYYSWRYGRWLSADWSSVPVPVPYANLTNPQTLNLYSMVSDDPESFADLDGHLALALSGNVGNDTTFTCDTSNAGCAPPSAPPSNPQGNPAAQQNNAPADQKLTNVVYNELGSGRADPKTKPSAPGSAEDLANGRQAVAEIANRVMDAGHPNRVAPSDLNDDAAVKTDAYAKSRVAADAALNGSNISNGATQYRTRVNGDITTPVGKSSTNPGTPVSQHYGPFIEGNHTFVIVVAQ